MTPGWTADIIGINMKIDDGNKRLMLSQRGSAPVKGSCIARLRPNPEIQADEVCA